MWSTSWWSSIIIQVNWLFVVNFLSAFGDFCCLLIIFVNNLDPDQAWQHMEPKLDPNFLTLWWYFGFFFNRQQAANPTRADNLCKQFWPRSGLTTRQAQSGSKLFNTLMVFWIFFNRQQAANPTRADNLCKQFGPRSRLTTCGAQSGSKLFNTLMVFWIFFFNRQQAANSFSTYFNIRRSRNFSQGGPGLTDRKKFWPWRFCFVLFFPQLILQRGSNGLFQGKL